MTDNTAGAFSQRMICVGVFGAPHGVRGALKVRVFTEVHDDFLNYPLYAKPFGDAPFVPEFAGYTEGGLILYVPGITVREQALTLKGCNIYSPRSAFPECEDDEFYIEDLKGLDAKTKDGAVYGTVTNVFDFGAGPVLELKRQDGSVSYMPFSEEVFPVSNPATGELVILPPDVIDLDNPKFVPVA